MTSAEKNRRRRPFIGMHFRCCNVYTRLYLNKSRRQFVGYCPRCCIKAVVNVSPTGSRSRFFRAT